MEGERSFLRVLDLLGRAIWLRSGSHEIVKATSF